MTEVAEEFGSSADADTHRGAEEAVLVVVQRDGLRLIDFTLDNMQACGTWHQRTMERVCDNIRPVIALLLTGPIAGPWADDDARWDAVSAAWQAYANPLCDEAGLIDFTELGAVVQIAVNKALALATTAPEAGAVGTTEGREPQKSGTREGADR